MGHHDVADTAYLKRRRGKGRSGYRWYVRVPVPRDLQERLRKKTVERALDTSDFSEAKKLKHSLLATIFADFERARRQTITSADIEHEAQRYLRERLDAISKQPDEVLAPLMDEFGNSSGLAGEAALVILHEALAEGDWPLDVSEEAIRIARAYGVVLTQKQRDELCRALLKGEIEALSRTLSIETGAVPEPISVLNAKAVDPLTSVIKPKAYLAPKRGDGIRVGDAASGYIGDRNRRRRGAWTGQTQNQARTTFRLFKEFTRDAPLAEITRNEVAAFLNTIGQLDPHYGRRGATKSEASLKDLLKDHLANAGDGLSNKTLNRHTSFIAGMFEWAIRDGKFEGSNPAKGHHRSSNDNEIDADNGRRSFTTEELRKLLDGSLFAAPTDKRISPTRHSVETALAWLIPIAMFSGMRLDEVCGLRAEDIGDDEGGLFFDLQSHNTRRLKTAAAKRRVPVHSELLRIGFAAYLANIRAEKHEYLFPALKPGGPDAKRSWYVSKRFTTYRRSVGVSDGATVFHCFRKNAATALERARVPENEAVQILGHKKMTMSYGLYSSGLDLAGLKRVIEAIAYPGLDLSHLHDLQTVPHALLSGSRVTNSATKQFSAT
jgi:integrase